MNTKRHLLVLDPTAFAGGSKIATENILKLLNHKQLNITVLTADAHCWKYHRLKRVKMYQPQWLAKQDLGIAYFLRHLVIALNILVARIRFGKIDITIGASGPGIDLALYLVSPLLKFKIIQLIHGPVARSRTIGRCLLAANEVHYLQSSETSLQSALSRLTRITHKKLPANFHIMQNGLSEQSWPSRCQTTRPVVFWAASLLKWKGLETLLNALQIINPKYRTETHICYIRPEKTPLPVSTAPVIMNEVHWHENPRHLDTLRSCANIFVSTSKNEPFGLSILEAMAAGQCVLIPADGAYWDKILKNGINCIKYTPDNATDLADKLLYISSNLTLIKSLGIAASNIALNYRAHKQYALIKSTLEKMTSDSKGRKTKPENTQPVS